MIRRTVNVRTLAWFLAVEIALLPLPVTAQAAGETEHGTISEQSS